MVYTAIMDDIDDTLAVTCDSCDWRGIVANVADIGDCMLTPGHPSPCGRCPSCDALVYLEE